MTCKYEGKVALVEVCHVFQTNDSRPHCHHHHHHQQQHQHRHRLYHCHGKHNQQEEPHIIGELQVFLI